MFIANLKYFFALPLGFHLWYIGIMQIVVHVIGARGRMGSRVVSLARARPEFKIDDETDHFDVAIDFSSHIATQEILKRMVALKKPVVIGTTAHPPENRDAIATASKEIPILFSPNFSLGMAVCIEAVELMAKRLYGFCSIDIVEAHHVHKKDKPSGTALALQQAAGKLDSPIHSIRAGDIIGDHTVIFTCAGERIELKHQVDSRDAFAEGALKAASFLIGKTPGLYSIKDLFS